MKIPNTIPLREVITGCLLPEGALKVPQKVGTQVTFLLPHVIKSAQDNGVPLHTTHSAGGDPVHFIPRKQADKVRALVKSLTEKPTK